jgi:hypothetical protein
MPKTIKVYEKFIVVEGWGDFPIDMLRYDSAFPLTEEDSAIAQTLGVWGHGRRCVALIVRSLNNLGPTEGRWASFTWKVVGVFAERHDAEECRRGRNLEIHKGKSA